MAIERRFPDSPDSVIHMTSNFLQMWAELQKEFNKAKMKKMGHCVDKWMSNKGCLMDPFSDIVVM
jgi:hypothetical protein